MYRKLNLKKYYDVLVLGNNYSASWVWKIRCSWILMFKTFCVTKIIYKWLANVLTIRVRGLVLLYFKFSCRSVFGSVCIYFAFRLSCWVLCFCQICRFLFFFCFYFFFTLVQKYLNIRAKMSSCIFHPFPHKAYIMFKSELTMAIHMSN